MSKICIITGATSGIGKAAALRLAVSPGTKKLYLIGRSKERCEQTVSEIRELNKDVPVKYLLCDLSSRKEILKLAQDLKQELNRVDLLINNAGGVFVKDEYSVDNLEMTWALNHFNYFWLTLALLDLLKAAKEARIVNVSSAAHLRARMKSVEGIFEVKGLWGYVTYGNTKLANLWFTFELARRLKDTAITVNALHPGLVATRFSSNNGVFGLPFKILTSTFGKTEEEGARTIVYLAESEEVRGVSGGYFVDEKKVQPSKLSMNEKLARDFWVLSEKKTEEIDKYI